jgi:hypothetical protein
MQLETVTKNLEKEVEHLLEKTTELHQRERTDRVHEVAKSQAERQALSTEQEDFIRLQRNDLPSNLVHPSQDEQADKLRQQEQNGKPNQQRRIVPSGAETSYCE